MAEKATGEPEVEPVAPVEATAPTSELPAIVGSTTQTDAPAAAQPAPEGDDGDRYVPPPVHLSWRASDALDFEVPEVEDPDKDILIDPPTQMVQATSRRADASERRARAQARAAEREAEEAEARAQAEADEAPDEQAKAHKGRRVLLLMMVVLVVAAAVWFFLQRNGTQAAAADPPSGIAAVSVSQPETQVGLFVSAHR